MYKVMIVDDEDIIVSGLVKVMPWAKYGCEVAATASDGLALAKTVLEKEKGDIIVNSELGKGSIFELRFYKTIV